MTILAERVTDLLEEQANATDKALRESEEYKNFEENYTDESTEKLKELSLKWQSLQDKINELEEQKMELEQAVFQEFGAVPGSYWSKRTKPKEILERYISDKKFELYGTKLFNRDKTLRRVSADILLSDIDSPEELVKNLVEKLK